jgi:hypothetical protein
MSFGHRSSTGLVDDEDDTSASPSLSRLLVGGLVVAVAGTLAAVLFLAEPDYTTSIEKAAANAGVTDELRLKLRLDFEKSLVEVGQEPCDEGLRDRVGKAAVIYYETLLEKPITAAGLEMTYASRCQPKLDPRTHPMEIILAHQGLGEGLSLPWGCLPSHWRTPADRAIQARIEHLIRTGMLTSDSLSGTLAIVARPKRGSPIAAMCAARSHFSGRREQLPVNAAPTDDWDRRPRGRRSYW